MHERWMNMSPEQRDEFVSALAAGIAATAAGATAAASMLRSRRVRLKARIPSEHNEKQDRGAITACFRPQCLPVAAEGFYPRTDPAAR
jgi:hypothetical protein